MPRASIRPQVWLAFGRDCCSGPEAAALARNFPASARGPAFPEFSPAVARCRNRRAMERRLFQEGRPPHRPMPRSADLWLARSVAETPAVERGTWFDMCPGRGAKYQKGRGRVSERASCGPREFEMPHHRGPAKPDRPVTTSRPMPASFENQQICSHGFASQIRAFLRVAVRMLCKMPGFSPLTSAFGRIKRIWRGSPPEPHVSPDRRAPGAAEPSLNLHCIVIDVSPTTTRSS